MHAWCVSSERQVFTWGNVFVAPVTFVDAMQRGFVASCKQTTSDTQLITDQCTIHVASAATRSLPLQHPPVSEGCSSKLRTNRIVSIPVLLECIIAIPIAIQHAVAALLLFWHCLICKMLIRDEKRWASHISSKISYDFHAYKLSSAPDSWNPDARWRWRHLVITILANSLSSSFFFPFTLPTRQSEDFLGKMFVERVY